MPDWIGKFFGLSDESDRVKHLAKVSALFMPIAALAFMMSTTFYSFFVAITLVGTEPGNLPLGFAFVGVLASISMAVQLVLDYPTGGVGDWIGQRWILLSAFACYAFSFFLTALASTFRYFWFFIIIYIVQAIAAAQQSGAIASWFDNNYRATAKDPERKAYSVAQGRLGMLFQISATAVLIPGAILATFFGYQFVFTFQAILCTVMGISALILFRDFPEVSENRPHRSLKAYYGVLKDGLRFAFSTRLVAFLIIGLVLMTSTLTVWGNMILFLLYYSYLSYSDVAVAIFRTVLFATGVLWIERAGVWTRNLSPPKWIPRSRLFQTCGPIFYFVMAIIVFILPPLVLPFPYMYLQIPTLLICAGFILTGIFSAFTNILEQRLLLDLIPDGIRNGIYSLFPTLTLLFSVPQILFFAMILPTYKMPAVLFGLGIISAIGLLILNVGLRSAPPSKTKDIELVPPVLSDKIP